VGDLTSCWDEIDKMLKNQFSEIQGSFGRSVTVMVHRYRKNKLFSELEGYVSKATLGFIYEEFESSRRFGFAKEDCGCVQMTTFGFPCACIFVEKRKKKLPILLDEIHPHWRRLCVIGEEVDATGRILWRKLCVIGEEVDATGRILSRWGTIDAQNPDSQCSHDKSNVPKSKGSRLGTCSRSHKLRLLLQNQNLIYKYHTFHKFHIS